MNKIAITFALLFFITSNILADGIWTKRADFSGNARDEAVGFSIGEKGYIATGFPNQKDFWEYDPTTNSWTQKADFSGTARFGAVGFSIGNKGYIGTGWDGSYRKDFWEYEPHTNSWTQKADFGGNARWRAVGFSKGEMGYIGTGSDARFYYNDFWVYVPIANGWIRKASFGGVARYNAVGFSINDKGYIGTGWAGSNFRKDFWEYDLVTDTWTQKADFGGSARSNAVGFSIEDKGYIATGWDGSHRKDFWEYYPNTNTWTSKADFEGAKRSWAIGFSIGNKGYIGAGWDGSNRLNDFWKYDPSAEPPAVPVLDFPPNDTTGVETKIVLRWKVPAESYRLQLSVDESFIATVFDSIGIENMELQIEDLENTTTYYWRVKAYNKVGESDWSDVWNFTTIISPPGTPHLLFPPNDTTGVPTSLTIGWKDTERAESYRVQIAEIFDVIFVDTSGIKSTELKIEDLKINTTYYWRVKATNVGGESKWSEIWSFTTSDVTIVSDLLGKPKEYILFQNYPNPFNPSTVIRYGIPERVRVTIIVYNLLGQEVLTLINEEQEAKYHEVIFDASGLSSGTYVVLMLAGDYVKTRKLIYLK